ncbi:C-type lectin domain family 5 member A-like [Argopecten irradians]|uniref:C-type lectin domain family 5 member A-like n=1 Tax=Argopecten irradians TaxID=31199 RepID=UPI003717BBD3
MDLDFFIKLNDAYWSTYDEATAYCLNDGARLAILDTTTKLNYVLALPDYDREFFIEWTFFTVLYYLVGATDEAQEDYFVWTTGNIVSRDAQFWLEFQPNNADGDQDCLTLHLSKYDDVTCTSDFQFICELV